MTCLGCFFSPSSRSFTKANSSFIAIVFLFPVHGPFQKISSPTRSYMLFYVTVVSQDHFIYRVIFKTTKSCVDGYAYNKAHGLLFFYLRLALVLLCLSCFSTSFTFIAFIFCVNKPGQMGTHP